MIATTADTGTPELPAQLLATAPVLDPQHAQLRERGVHRRDGGWVIGRTGDVVEALSSPALIVALGSRASQGGARRLQAQMARFTDPPQHGRRRAVLERLLPDVVGLAGAASQETSAAVRAWTGGIDVMPLAKVVPVSVLAGALGVPVAHRPQVAVLTGALCDALAPSLGEPPATSRGDDAAGALIALLTATSSWDHEQVIAAAGLLFQARDATAALIGGALLTDRAAHPSECDDGPFPHDPAVAVERALRQAAPVQCTRRTTSSDVLLAGALVPAGEPVWVVLAAAEDGAPAQPMTFGAGVHACPGAAHAVALACGVLTGLDRAGYRTVPEQDVQYEPRPNLRTPVAVLVRRP